MSCTCVYVLNRHDILQLTEVSLYSNRPDYARKLARAWLQAWPRDFAVNLLLARALSAESDHNEALEILIRLAIIDPEHAEVHQQISTVADLTGDTEMYEDSDGLSRVLTGGSLPRVPWMVAARESINAIEGRQWEPARQAAERALQANPDTPLPALLLLKSHWLAGQSELAFPLAQGFFDRWPECVALILCLAEALLHSGDYTRGVDLLHNVVVLDPAGEVVDRYWGADHVYRPIWPPEPRIQQVAPIPPEIATRLGINRLEAQGNGTPAGSADKECNHGSGSSDANPNNENVRFASESQMPDVEITEPPEAKNLLTSDTEIPGIEEGLPLDGRPTAQAAPETLHDVQTELERVRHQLDAVSPNRRINGSRPRLRGEGVHVIITCARALVDKYGARNAERVLTLTRLLAESTARNTGLQCSVVLPDVADSLAPFGLAPV
ncbi:MAG: hypothetical protein QF660_06465, partial [Anaerolineales bacterium]|nr:hypothetical protein [Anaerolineales bacterium]